MTATEAVVDRHARIAVGLDIQPAEHFAVRIVGLPISPTTPGLFLSRTRELRNLTGGGQ